MSNISIIGTSFEPLSRNTILEKVKNYIDKQSREGEVSSEMLHVVSVNPEILVTARTDEKFKRVIETAQIQIVDGAGVVVAGRLLYSTRFERFSGTDLMEALLAMSGKDRYPVLFIGGGPKIAQKLAECYSQKFPGGEYLGILGINDIKSPTKHEEEAIFSIVARMRPRLVFVSFGSPWQELWIEANRTRFAGSVCVGVGGAFNYLSGSIPRAPQWMRSAGLEWLHRLVIQPSRLHRQIKLPYFAILVGLQWLGRVFGPHRTNTR